MQNSLEDIKSNCGAYEELLFGKIKGNCWFIIFFFEKTKVEFPISFCLLIILEVYIYTFLVQRVFML